jgi:hypothetical protein
MTTMMTSGSDMNHSALRICQALGASGAGTPASP